jgi:hypothetical protein
MIVEWEGMWKEVALTYFEVFIIICLVGISKKCERCQDSLDHGQNLKQVPPNTSEKRYCPIHLAQ